MARRRNPPYDPLGPISPRQQRQLARQYVNALVNPLMRQIEAQFNRQMSGGAGLIRGYTNQLQTSLGPLAESTRSRYSTADQQLAQIDNALANRLTAAGQAGGAELQAKLEKAGIGGSSSQDPNAIGTGAAAAGYAKGSSARQALVQQGTAATDYAASLPGIAGLQGGQTLRQYGAQLANQRQTAMENLRGRVPGLVQQVGQQLSNLDFQRAAARIGFIGDTAKLAQDQTQFGARQQLDQAQFGETVRSHRANEAAAQARIRASQSQTNRAAQAKRQQAFYTVRGKAATLARSLYSGVTSPSSGAQTPSAGGGYQAPGGTGGSTKVRPTYQVAYNKLWATFAPQLINQYGYKRPAVETMFRRVLFAAGFRPPPMPTPLPGTAGRGPGGVGPR